MILRLERHCFDILNDLEELRPSGGFQNLILPPGPGCEISDDVFFGANVLLGHHQTCSILQDVGGKHHPHERDSMKSRDDQTICELVKMFVDLPICTIASGLVNNIWMQFDLKYENWVTLPFDNVNCGEVDQLPALKKRILRVDQKPILVFEDVDQQGVLRAIPLRLYGGIRIDGIELIDY